MPESTAAMKITVNVSQLLIGAVIGALLAGGGYAIAATTSTKTIHACVSKSSKALTVRSKCPKGTTALVWNQKGQHGATGKAGATGATGPAGQAASVKVGTVTTSTTATTASVTNTGTSSAAVLDFTLPEATTAVSSNGEQLRAWGQLLPGASETEAMSPTLAYSSGNINDLHALDPGTYYFNVSGCSAVGIADPIIQATPDDDDNDADNSVGTITAMVTAWGTNPDNDELYVELTTGDATTGDAVDADVQFSVIC